MFQVVASKFILSIFANFIDAKSDIQQSFPELTIDSQERSTDTTPSYLEYSPNIFLTSNSPTSLSLYQ